jgi:hypothetical protein
MVPNHQPDVSIEAYGDLGIPILGNLLKRFLNVAFDQQKRGRTLCQPERQILTSFGRPTGLF